MSLSRPRLTISFALAAILAALSPLSAQEVVVPEPPKSDPTPRQEARPSAGSTAGAQTISLDPTKPFPDYHRLKGYPKIPIANRPKNPPTDGQKLIEWHRMPILDYVIPEKWRGMNIACGEISANLLEDAAATCAPLLAMAKLRAQIEFTAFDATTAYPTDRARAEQFRAETSRLAEQMVTDHGKVQWPLAYYLLARTYLARAGMADRWEDWPAALADLDKAIELLSGDPLFDEAEPMLAGSYARKGDALLAQKKFAEAAINYDTAFAATPDNMFAPFSALEDHSETMVTAAIFAGDRARAGQWLDRHFRHFAANAEAHGRSANWYSELLRQKLLALRLYLDASSGDERALRETLARYERSNQDRKGASRGCTGNALFPRVVAPFHKKADIAAKLRAMGCSLDGLDAVPTQGIRATDGKLLLPPHR